MTGQDAAVKGLRVTRHAVLACLCHGPLKLPMNLLTALLVSKQPARISEGTRGVFTVQQVRRIICAMLYTWAASKDRFGSYFYTSYVCLVPKLDGQKEKKS